jgi:hypothetical protein
MISPRTSDGETEKGDFYPEYELVFMPGLEGK